MTALGTLSEDELLHAYGAGPSGDPAHVPQPHELRNAWHTAKQLEERLEIADQPELRRIALQLRESLFTELMRVEGFEEVGDG